VEGSTEPTANHRDGNVNVGSGYPVQANGSAFTSCSTATCHSDGMSATGSTPNWGTPGDCATCHASDMTTGSHTIHLANGAVCGDCHNGAVKDSNAGTAHTDSNVDVIAGYATANAAYGSASWTTCNAASCHDNGTGTLVTTPDWGTSAACTECHTTIPATGAHTAHLTQTISTAISIECTDCHDGAVWGTSATTTGHRDGNVDVTGGYGYPANAGKGAPYDSCATTYCHGDNMPAGTASGINAPNWGTPNVDGCNFCHKVADTGGTIPSHSGVVATDCITCHGAGKGSVNAAGTGFTNGGATHIDGNLDGGGDSCSDCHANIGSGLNGAHAAHNATAYNGLISNGDYGNAANGWYDVTYIGGVPSFACGYCHPSTVAGHTTKQVSLNPADAGAAGTVKAMNNAGATYSAGTCSATYCHSDGVNVAAGSSPNWTSGSISGNCNDCHGNSPTTNAHGVHEVGIHYEELYDGTSGLLTATGTVGSGAAHGDSNVSSTISCYSCHAGTVTDSANALNSTCNACHTDNNTAIDGDENARILTSSSTHLNGTKDVVFADLTTFKSKAQLRDNLADADDGSNVLSDLWNRVTGYKGATDYDQPAVNPAAFAGGSCSSVSCHNGVTATWTDTGVDCMYCHTSLPK
jgi:predicted CxxxxCH...CXXCH cytochrome family protein